MEVLNWGLIRHPMNWVTLILMVIIAAAALHFVCQYAVLETTTTES